MYGAIIGDIVGSVYEWNRIKTKDFPPVSTQAELLGLNRSGLYYKLVAHADD